MLSTSTCQHFSISLTGTDASKDYHRKTKTIYMARYHQVTGLEQKSLFMAGYYVGDTEMPQMFKILHVNALNCLLSPKDT